MKKKLTSLILSLALILTCVPTVASAAEGTLITEQYRDTVIIPDNYNTGVEEGVILTTFTDSAMIGTVVSDDGGNAPLVERGPSYFYINSYTNNSLAEESVIEGYDFSEMKFTTTNSVMFTDKKTITFKNCKFQSVTHDVSNTLSNLYFVFENCTFNNVIAGSNITLNNCYIGDSNSVDGVMAYTNFYMNNCYIANLLSTSNSSDMHVDGIQIPGLTYYETENISLNNVRFGLPQFYLDGENKATVNAAIMVQLDYNNASDLSFEDCIIDMGGAYTPFYCWQKSSELSNVTFRNIKVTDMYANNTSLFYQGGYYEDTVVENVACSSGLYISSVWKDEDNKTHIICTNNSILSSRTLKVVTNLGEYEFEMERMPSQSELLTNATYQTYTWNDMPYNVDCVIEEDVDYVVCYDTEVCTENQIRFVNYTNEDVYIDISIENINSSLILVTEQYRDTVIIPDKYNTGLSNPELCTKKLACGTYADNGVYIRNNQSTSGVSNEDSTSYLIQFANNSQPTSNKSLSGEYVFENYDFATDGIQIGVTGRYNAQNPVKFVFRNCKFALWKGYDEIHTSDGECLVETVFENCSFESFSDSHSTLNNCYFGNTSANTAGKDGINPLNNCTFNNCFISNLVKPIADNGLHVDGMQSNCCQDIVFNNCRWEIPKLNLSQSCGVTAAVFVQPKETDDETGETILSNFRFNNCYINGGGIYEIQLPETGYDDELSFSNCVFGECYTGKRVFYYENSQELFCDDTCKNVDSLYVSSVWKDSNQKVHLSVTNDTRQERTLLVCTSNDNYTFTAPKMLICDEMEVDSTTYEDMPFDIELIVPETDYIVCYDITDENNPQQIRFVNYTSEDVYVDLDAESTEITVPTVPTTPVIPEGDILFNASISSVFEIKIPNQIALNKEANEIELLATADIGGTETLSIETPNIVTLTSKNNETYDAGVNLSQSILTSSELFTGKRVTMVIDCSELLPGEWDGAIDIQFILK